MNTYKNPTWWTKDNDSSWDRVKAAMKRDWDQTKIDMGANRPETKQNANDTIKQAAGKEAIPPRGEQVYEKAEPALRFGYGARAKYGKQYSTWNQDLEKELQRDWKSTYPENENAWETNSKYIHSGWDFQE